jgi:hypothetical protein
VKFFSMDSESSSLALRVKGDLPWALRDGSLCRYPTQQIGNGCATAQIESDDDAR